MYLGGGIRSERHFYPTERGKETGMIDEANLSEIVGADHVSREEAALEKYAGDMSFVRAIRPDCVVKPGNAEEIFKIVNLARETETPLVPVSSGEPHFLGDTVPGAGGAMIVDLSGMKNIVHIDRKNRVAMFEPGVTFAELSAAVAEEGLRLNMPLIPRRSKSVVGSLLERQPVIMPKYHWDIADPLACTEVIFGTGEIFRTGAAAGSGSIKEQWAAGGVQKEAAGPSAASWYRLIQGAQGTMGIVTWVSARCELLPRLEEAFFVTGSELDKIMETMHWLIRLRLVNECLVLNNTNLARIMAAEGADRVHQLKDDLPPWVLFFTIAAYEYLPEERMSGQKRNVGEFTQRLGAEAVQALRGVTAAQFLKAVKHPSAEPYWKLRHGGGCQDIFFLTIFEKLPGLIKTMNDTAYKAGHAVEDLGVYLQPIVQGVNCHCEFNLYYDINNTRERDRVRDLTLDATSRLLKEGAFFSRPYGESAEMIMNRDAASVMTLKKIKGIVDPKNIMNPGKLCF
jgi:FAD/FMN-containing dehydrogenase